MYDRQNTQVPRTRLVVTQKETKISTYRKIPTVSMSSQTRTGKTNTTILIAINIQSYQRLRRLIHKYSNRHCAQACTMTSQYPVKIHVVASCSVLHHKNHYARIQWQIYMFSIKTKTNPLHFITGQR